MELDMLLATGYFNIEEPKYECCKMVRNKEHLVMYYWFNI